MNLPQDGLVEKNATIIVITLKLFVVPKCNLNHNEEGGERTGQKN